MDATKPNLTTPTNCIGFSGKVRGESFIPLLDGVKLTPEQLNRLFPEQRRVQFLRELVSLAEQAAGDGA